MSREALPYATLFVEGGSGLEGKRWGGRAVWLEREGYAQSSLRALPGRAESPAA